MLILVSSKVNSNKYHISNPLLIIINVKKSAEDKKLTRKTEIIDDYEYVFNNLEQNLQMAVYSDANSNFLTNYQIDYNDLVRFSNLMYSTEDANSYEIVGTQKFALFGNLFGLSLDKIDFCIYLHDTQNGIIEIDWQNGIGDDSNGEITVGGRNCGGAFIEDDRFERVLYSSTTYQGNRP